MENFFASNLRYLREQKNISQIDLANALGVSLSAISHWENALREPNMEMIVKIANFFQTSEDMIISNLKERKTATKSQHKRQLFHNEDFTIELYSPIPLEHLPIEKQKEIYDTAMEELIDLKKELKQKKELPFEQK